MDWCDPCAAALEDLRFLGTALRVSALGQDSLSHEEATALTAAVVSRRKAEQDASFFARAQRMFDDMHLVYAGVGATAATAVCLVIMFSMLRFASFGRPDATPAADGRSDSLAAMLDVLATPGSSADAMAIDSASHARWASSGGERDRGEGRVVALDAIVTRDGRCPTCIAFAPRQDELNLIEAFPDTVTRSRIEPGAADATQAAANSTWSGLRPHHLRAVAHTGDLERVPARKKKRSVTHAAPAPQPFNVATGHPFS